MKTSLWIIWNSLGYLYPDNTLLIASKDVYHGKHWQKIVTAEPHIISLHPCWLLAAVFWCIAVPYWNSTICSLVLVTNVQEDFSYFKVAKSVLNRDTSALLWQGTAWKVRVSNPGIGRRIFILCDVHTVFGADQATFWMGTMFFPGDKAAGAWSWSSPHLAQRLGMSGAVSTLPLRSHGDDRDKFNLTSTNGCRRVYAVLNRRVYVVLNRRVYAVLNPQERKVYIEESECLLSKWKSR